MEITFTENQVRALRHYLNLEFKPLYFGGLDKVITVIDVNTSENVGTVKWVREVNQIKKALNNIVNEMDKQGI